MGEKAGREEMEAGYPGPGLGPQVREYEETLSAFTVMKAAFFERQLASLGGEEERDGPSPS